MRSINPLLDRMKRPTPRNIPSRLCEKKNFWYPDRRIKRKKVADAFRRSSMLIETPRHWLNLNFWQVLLEKLRGDTPKLCDSLVMNDVDTSAPGASDSGVGSSVTSPGEGRNGGQPTPQGKFSVAFQQVRKRILRGSCAFFSYIVLYMYHHSERIRF